MTITISNDGLHATNEQLAARVADLEREADILAGECRDAQATARQFANERDQARRERNLARAEARVSGEMVAAMSRHMRDARIDNARLTDENVRLVVEASALRLRLAIAESRGRRRFPGTRRDR